MKKVKITDEELQQLKEETLLEEEEILDALEMDFTDDPAYQIARDNTLIALREY